MKYTFEIVETLTEIVMVEAESKGDAYRKVKKMYDDEDIVLEDSNHLCTEISPI